ncbi:MAG: hydroxyacid dehydrogenase [archaeon]|nr:hydroxyacid dehydrogenase [archaeon]
MKIAFFEVEKWEENFLKERLKNHTLYFSSKELTPSRAKKISSFDAIGVFIYSQVTSKVLDQLPKLKLITTLSTGFDHIDLEECKKRKIIVTNVPTYGENTVAEHTFALLLTLSRKILEAYNRTQRADFSADGLKGFDLKDKTIGVIGCGHIGQHVVRIANGFQMKVIVYEPHKDKILEKKLGFKYVSLDYLYKNSDIITFHVPLVESTKHMVNKGTLAKFKKGVILINTARGGIIDTAALITGLSKGIIGGAGLDVLEGECYIREEKQVINKNFPKECNLKTILQNHVLIKEPNVLITPHCAFNSQEALERILETTIKNIDGFSAKKKVNAVH